MFLSRVQLNPARRAARPLLDSPHVLHAAVMAAFPDASPTVDGRVLWRRDDRAHTTDVYIVSPRRPDLMALAEQGGWPSLPETQATRPYDPLLTAIAVGDSFAFRLTANPTRSHPDSSEGRGKVFGHVTAAQQELWLVSRQERIGVRIGGWDRDAASDTSPLESRLVVTDRRTVLFSRRETRVTLRVATFQGTLTVVDPALFVHALTHGIGRAKGYGCGLMTIAPVR